MSHTLPRKICVCAVELKLSLSLTFTNHEYNGQETNCVHLTQRIADLKGPLKAQKKCLQELRSVT